MIADQLIDRLDLPAPGPRVPVLVALFGLPGTGKTTLAHSLVELFPLALLCTDEIRQHFVLASGPATHAVMYDAAAILLQRKIGIVWDGIHLGRRDRERLRVFAADQGALCQIIFVTASDETIQQRLSQRLNSPDAALPKGIYAITPEHFRRIASYLEVPAPDEDVLTIDTTDGQVEPALDELTRRLREISR